jgi:hypothetical protein
MNEDKKNQVEVHKSRKLKKNGKDLNIPTKDIVIQEIAKALPSIIEMGMDILKLNAQAKAYWEKTRSDIERISKEADILFAKLQYELSQAKEKTERLRILTETINKHPNLPPILQEGISKALENITREL